MPRLVGYEQVTQPSDLRGMPTARAYGEGLAADTDVSRILAQSARDVRSAGSDVHDRVEATGKAWAAQAMSQARLDWTTAFAQAKAEAEPGAVDFTPNVLGKYDEYSEKALEGAPTPTARAFYAGQLAQFREQLGEKSTLFEADARVAYQEQAYTQGIQNTAKLMNEDPEQFLPALGEQVAILEASSMGPIKKGEFLRKAVNEVSEAAVWSQINRSPTGFLQSIGAYSADGKLGDLKGKTGNAAFDMMTFDARVKYYGMAVSEKARIDREGDDAVNGRDVKSNSAALRKLYTLLQTDPGEAEKYAIDANRRGLLSQEDMKSGWSKAREIGRQEGPNSEYERSRDFIKGSLDPGPMVQDPVGRARLAEATDMFDRWRAANPKASDGDVYKRGREIVAQFRFVNLSDTIVGLPQPRFAGTITRNPNPAQITSDVTTAGLKLQKMRESGEISEADYNAEMAILNRWRKTATGQ